MSRETLTKAEFSRLINSIGVPVGEGEQYLDDETAPQKIAYWEYLWTDITGSGGTYETVVRYQVSYASTRARDSYLKALKQALNIMGLHPQFFHEYVKGTNGPGYHHWYCAVDVLEDVLLGV